MRTGKTLIALASIYAHTGGRPFTAIAMAPPQIHHDVRDRLLLEPLTHFFQIGDIGIEAPGLTCWVFVGGARQYTAKQGALADVNSATAFNDSNHKLFHAFTAPIRVHQR